MSYSIDIYRGELKAEKNFLAFLYYTIFFPQLVAGPIVRAIEFLPQVQTIPTTNRTKLKVGISIFLTGLLKRLLIANSVSPYVDHVFEDPSIYSSLTVWCAVVAYALQIYCDFSGYTDMAIGVAKMFGHSLVDNFNMPYLSRSITEFWRRWHMSLSRWIKDYIYISLGGSRKGRYRTYLNLILTMMIGGLWHGASWNFVIWGMIHGFALAFEKFFHLDKKYLSGVFAYFRWALTMIIVLVAWVFFRANNIQTAFAILSKTFSIQEGLEWIQTHFVIVLAVALLAHFVAYFFVKAKFMYLFQIIVHSGECFYFSSCS
jgi:alginate O-acetyltransferase complex protein AlgI